VPAALILAILTQETNLGENQGSCYVKDLATGNGVGKNTGRAFNKVMAAPRDTTPFQTITESLGRDWSNTPVSCPQSVGYGGAMGPSQFIPSTWMLYKTRLANLTGETFPDPWNARTAIFATALLMEDNGGDGGTRESWRKAALRYFAGGNWSKPANAPYGDGVLRHLDKIQAEINILEGK
jgi:membrane-bound lytic murein transglycosylase B